MLLPRWGAIEGITYHPGGHSYAVLPWAMCSLPFQGGVYTDYQVSWSIAIRIRLIKKEEVHPLHYHKYLGKQHWR